MTGPGKVSGGSESQPLLAGRDSSELPLWQCNAAVVFGNKPPVRCALRRGHRGVHFNGEDVAWTR